MFLIKVPVRTVDVTIPDGVVDIAVAEFIDDSVDPAQRSCLERVLKSDDAENHLKRAIALYWFSLSYECCELPACFVAAFPLCNTPATPGSVGGREGPDLFSFLMQEHFRYLSYARDSCKAASVRFVDRCLDAAAKQGSCD